MRRRSERKKSTEAVSPPPVLKRSSRRSQRSSSSQGETRKTSKTEEATGIAEIVNEDTKDSGLVTETTSNNGDLKERRSSLSPDDEQKRENTNDQPLETIAEIPVEQNEETEIKNEISNDSEEANTTENKAEQSRESPESHIKEVETHTEITPTEEKSPEQSSNEVSSEEKELTKNDEENKSEVSNFKQKYFEEEAINKPTEVTEDSKENQQKETEKNKSPEKVEKSAAVNEYKRTISRNRDRRSQLATKQKKERENDENEEFNNNSEKFSTPLNEKTQNTRKRRWLSKKTADSSSQILAISTDSLKNLISDVHPVPLSDVKLESSSDVEEIESEREEGEASPTPVKVRTEKTSIFDREHKMPTKTFEQPMRKISVLTDREEHSAPIPTRNATSCILYITNLVRPFTVLQLKGLLARTGKIVENRFWIDKIKSKCFVEYETEDEAVETRHALHGVRWPTSNPKCLNVDFGTVHDMEKALASSQDSGPQFGQEIGRENRIVGTGWDRDRFDFEEKKIQVGRPVREWDVGKREEIDNESRRAKEREKLRNERGERVIHNDRVDRESLRNRDHNDKERDRKRRSPDREHRRSLSVSPARKIKKKSNDPPLRLLDDLFRKTKTTPCIYWLPLTPEQIAEKEAFRLRRVAEHQERIRQRELEKEKGREKEREREREREKERSRRERDRSIGHRRSNSRDRRRY